MDGGLLYTDFVDNKPPLFYAYYTLAQILFGRSLFAVHLFTILFVVPLTALAASAFFDHDSRGMMAALLFLTFSAAFLAHDMHAAQCEIVMILPASWALVLIRNEQLAQRFRNICGAGFLMGLAVLLKHQIATWLIAICIAVVIATFQERRFLFRALLHAGILGFTFALPLFLTYLMFQMRGGGDAFLFWIIQSSFKYGANPISSSEALGRAASYFLPFLLVTSPLWWCAFRSIRMEQYAYRKLLLTFLLLFSFPSAIVGFRFFPHYFIIFYIPLCIAAAPYAAQIVRPLTRSGKWLIGYSLGILIVFTIINAVLYYGSFHVYRETDPIFSTIANHLRRDQCYTGGTLFVWGYTPLYYEAQLKPASRFVALPQAHLTGYMPGNLGSIRNEIGTQKFLNTENWKLLISDLEKNKATYIIDTAPAGIYRWDHYPIRDYPILNNYLQQKYDQIDQIEGVVIYRRKGCSQL